MIIACCDLVCSQGSGLMELSQVQPLLSDHLYLKNIIMFYIYVLDVDYLRQCVVLFLAWNGDFHLNINLQVKKVINRVMPVVP